MLYSIDYTLMSNTREKIREELILLFLQEKPGCETESSGYKYIVENIAPYNIYLQRPAPLNKGFDFVVNVENMYFKLGDKRRHRNPSHQDIVAVLLSYKQQFTQEYCKLRNLINRIFQCENFDVAQEAKDLPPFTNYDGEMIPIAVILCSIKWLFIEQDITYWNWSGRFMLFRHLQDESLV